MNHPTYTLTRAQRMMTGACASGDGRPALACLNIRRDGVLEACDGHILMRMTDTAEKKSDVKERMKRIPDKGLMMSGPMVAHVQRVQGELDAVISHDADFITIETEIGTILHPRSHFKGDQYPATDQVEPIGDVQHDITISLEVLETLTRTIRRIFPRRGWQCPALIPIKLKFFNKPGVRSTEGLGVQFSISYPTKSGEELSGLIMAMHDGHDCGSLKKEDE